MTPFTRAIALASLIAVQPVAAFADPASYDDSGMHFAAPDDYVKIDVPPATATGNPDSDDPTPLALFVYHKGKSDQRAISIVVARFDGSVDQFDTQHVSDERKADDVFVVVNKKTALQNGMPAYFLKVNAGSTAGQFSQHYSYLVCDGTRSIVVSLGGATDINDDAAKAAMASLYVVVFPKHRV